MTKKRKRQCPETQPTHNMTRPIPHCVLGEHPGPDEPGLATTGEEEPYLQDGELFRPWLFLIPE